MKKEKETERKTRTLCGKELSSRPVKRESFVLYTSLRESISDFSYEEKGMLLDAILEYANGEEKCVVKEKLNGSAKVAFSFVSKQLDLDFKKYEEACEKKRKAANKRWEKSGKDACASSALHNENESESETESETETETETESKNGKEEKNSSFSSSSKNDSDAVAKNEEEEDEKKRNLKIMEYVEKNWLPWFNDMLEKNESAIPRFKIMTLERAKNLVRLVEKYNSDTVATVFRRAAQKPFLNGRGKKCTFVANIDWLLEEKNFLNVYENKFYG